MIKILVPARADLSKGLKKTYFDMVFATEDNAAHQIDVQLFRGREAAQLESGASVTAYFIRYSDNATITLGGSVSDGIASVTLNKSCYNKAGQFAIIIKVVEDGVINTVFYGEGTILTSVTDTILDDENIIPSLDDLLAQIAVMEQATADAATATEAANTATGAANTAADTANAAAYKIDGMTVSAEKADEAGATITEVDGVKHIAFSLPKGDKGDKGDPGTIENVTITSINGLEEALAGKQPVGAYTTSVNNVTPDEGGNVQLGAGDVGALPSDNWLDSIYPVGSIYTSVNDTSPAQVFGGVWEQITGRFLFATGAPDANDDGASPGEYNHAAGTKGGADTATLTAENLAEHSHSAGDSSVFFRGTAGKLSRKRVTASESSSDPVAITANSAADLNVSSTDTGAAGAAQPFDIMPPYLAVYMWMRLADDTEVA